MKINVQVKTRSSKIGVEKIDDSNYIVRVNTPPVDGEANKKVIELLSKYFKTAKSNIELTRGSKSKKKVFIILSLQELT